MWTDLKVQHKILTIFVGVFVLFLMYIYHLGAQVPEEEFLVDGEWVSFQSEDALRGPGYIEVFTQDFYSSPFVMIGEAKSTWFPGGEADGFLFSFDGELLWRGPVNMPDDRYVFDLILPFEARINTGNFVGEALFVIEQADESGLETESPFYSVPILIGQPGVVPAFEFE